ncbi:MAG: biotin/lipoyl-binding protein [Candidatus Caenarcaniphilales bacterium]|nr:biotin/lipoyl-binding protein [Candidatus Caenarcaniphilales bacterium]
MNSFHFKSTERVESPAWVGRYGYVLFCLLISLILGLIFIPWQQTIMGMGDVTSFTPDNRPQQIEAPIKGRIEKWYVKEGDLVQKGQVLLELFDLEKDFYSPDLIALTETSRDSLIQTRAAYAQKADALSQSIGNLSQNLNDSINAAQQNVKVAEVDLKTAQLNLERIKILNDKGLSSTREYELAIQTENKTLNDLNRLKIELDRIQSKTLSEITKLESERAASLGEVAKLSDEIAKTNLKLQTAEVRREISQVKAPYNGYIVKLLKRGVGETFKENEQIAVITPLVIDQAVQLFISDIDAPLVAPGDRVRLQFSGWPALVFAGFLDFARAGTFGGIVKVVDNVDSGNGKYRILVEPDPAEHPWPLPKYLRPGTRAAGWVLLRKVSLGYEIWRRFSGFPLSIADIKPIPKDETYFNQKPPESEKEIIYKRKLK